MSWVQTGFFGRQVRDASESECENDLARDGRCRKLECELHREKISSLRYTTTEGGDWHYLNFHSVELPDGMIWDSHCDGPRK